MSGCCSLVLNRSLRSALGAPLLLTTIPSQLPTHSPCSEFPQLLTVGSVLELGCGAGNSAFPLLELNPAARIYACDFAPSAVALVRAAPQYAAAAGRLTAFVADIIGEGGRGGAVCCCLCCARTCQMLPTACLPLPTTPSAADDLTAHVPPASVEAATMIFVLSAITAEAQPLALRRVAATLRPGGQLLFRQGPGDGAGGAAGLRQQAKRQTIDPCTSTELRSISAAASTAHCRDYAAGDLAEARLGGEGRQQQVGPSCFVRWDGTLAYYFSQVLQSGRFPSL